MSAGLTAPPAPWRIWAGEQLPGPESGYVSLDTETTVVDLRSETPDVVLLVACLDGETAWVVPRGGVRPFFAAHAEWLWETDLVFHNAAFDVLALTKLLGRRGEHSAGWLWEAVDAGRVHDTMLLDQLVRLARGVDSAFDRKVADADENDRAFTARSLEKVSLEWAPEYACDKKDPYRLRFGELLAEPDWSRVDRGFFDYAARDALATWHVWGPLRDSARRLHEACLPPSGSPLYSVDPGSPERFGALTERLQVQGSIALRTATLNGLGLDLSRAREYEAELRRRVTDDWAWMIATYPQLFTWKRKDKKSKEKTELVLTPKARTPKVSQKLKREVLEGICAANGVPVPKSVGKKVVTSLKVADWLPHEGLDPFVDAMIRLDRSAKLLGFFDVFHKSGDRVHPEYRVLVRTGRVSCHSPNAQQWPRDKAFRRLFVPRPGKRFLVVDYSAAELRTLAAVCKHRFGFSKLADVFAEGRDPHTHTAALMTGTPYEDLVRSLGDPDDPGHKKAKAGRQAAKPVNFGVPGGMGGPSLVAYAKATYGVTLTPGEASAFRERLINEIYPEIGLYLADDTPGVLALNLGLPPAAVTQVLERRGLEPGVTLYCTGRVALGEPVRRDGEPYKHSWVNTLWELLGVYAGLSPSLEEFWRRRVRDRRGSPELYHRLFAATAVTLTGRVRAGCNYCASRNSPFQGLAADAAKLAMWRLVRDGFGLCAFIHDEFIVEIDAGGGEGRAQSRVNDILCGAMRDVTGGVVPVAVEGHVADYWLKA